MICVSLQKKTLKDFQSALVGMDFLEIRLDGGYLRIQEVTELFSSHPKLIATCRPGGLTDSQRERILAAAIKGGAAYVDIEMGASYSQNLIELARSKNCKVIVSFHDDKKTPSLTELLKISSDCHEQGADIVKIACMANTLQDCARMISLLDADYPVIPISMGPLGKISRIVAPVLGAPFMYATNSENEETAPGQIEAGRLALLIKELSDV